MTNNVSHNGKRETISNKAAKQKLQELNNKKKKDREKYTPTHTHTHNLIQNPNRKP